MFFVTVCSGATLTGSVDTDNRYRTHFVSAADHRWQQSQCLGGRHTPHAYVHRRSAGHDRDGYLQSPSKRRSNHFPRDHYSI